MENLYEVLGVEKDAKQEDIKKAYRRLSMRWHPDKNKLPEAADKFKKISEAYSILSDVNNRREYDMKKDGFDVASLNMPDLFKVFMGGQSGPGPGMGMPFGFPPGMVGINIGGFGGNGEEGDFSNIQNIFSNLRKPPPIINNVEITLKEAYSGLSVPVKIKRCITSKETKMYEDETIYIQIPAGVDDGEIMVSREKGNVIYPDLRGDVKTFIKITNETSFKRHGLDLDYTHIISLKEALCGFTFEIEHLNGTCYKINNHSGTIIHPSYKKTIPKKGMIRDGMEGNLNIHFLIEFPKTLSADTIEKIKEIF